MFGWLVNALRVPDLRRRLAITALILGVYRFGSWLPTPWVDPNAAQRFLSTNGSSILGLLNLLSGSALSRLSLFALGIVPYVTASIVMQVLTTAVPALEQLQKEGEAGYARINQYTRYAAVGFAAVQATGYTFLFEHGGAVHLDAGRCGPGAGLLDPRRRAVEARHVVAALGQVDRVVTESASGVEHLPRDCTERFKLHEPRLSLPDIPGDGLRRGRTRERRPSAVEAFIRPGIVTKGFGCGMGHVVTVQLTALGASRLRPAGVQWPPWW